MILRVAKWFISIFSDAKGKGSSKRIAGGISMFLFTVVTYESLYAEKFKNSDIVSQIAEYLFIIILIALLGVSAVDIFTKFKFRNPFIKEPTQTDEDNTTDNQG